jgi:hypothetical protein
MPGVITGMIFHNGLSMISLDSYLHIIGIGLLALLTIVLALIDAGKTKRVIFRLFLTALGFMLAHFFTHLLPNTIAEFIYSSHQEYQSVKPFGTHRS